jgi:ketol-acid reductoisomerase
VASDGYSAEITYEELSACSKCIITFLENYGLLAVMPDFSSKLQVRDLIELQIH